MKNAKTLTMITLGLCLAGLAASCDKGPAQKAGEKIDNAVQDTKDTVKDAARDVKKDATRN